MEYRGIAVSGGFFLSALPLPPPSSCIYLFDTQSGSGRGHGGRVGHGGHGGRVGRGGRVGSGVMAAAAVGARSVPGRGRRQGKKIAPAAGPRLSWGGSGSFH